MTDINDLIAANVKLVYLVLHRFNLVDDQDAESDAYFALYKAATTYEDSKGYTFSTYAVTCISNALRQLIRKRTGKRAVYPASLYDYVAASPDCTTTINDTIADVESTESIVFYNELEAVLPEVIDRVISRCRSNSEKSAMIVAKWIELTLAGKTIKQRVIAEEVGVSQPQVSRQIKIAQNYLREELEDYL